MTSLFLSISIEFVSFSLFRWSYLFLDEYTPDLISILTCKEEKEKKKKGPSRYRWYARPVCYLNSFSQESTKFSSILNWNIQLVPLTTSYRCW